MYLVYGFLGGALSASRGHLLGFLRGRFSTQGGGQKGVMVFLFCSCFLEMRAHRDKREALSMFVVYVFCRNAFSPFICIREGCFASN